LFSLGIFLQRSESLLFRKGCLPANDQLKGEWNESMAIASSRHDVRESGYQGMGHGDCSCFYIIGKEFTGISPSDAIG
jgi:hypothetical protein